MNPSNVFHNHQRTARILIADADAATRAMYRESLQEMGCDVVEAVDGREALVNALAIRPTLVITETLLRGFDGYELCKVLRRDRATRTVPILVVTTETRGPELDRAHAAGADAVLLKPVSPDDLLKEIHRLLDRSEPSLDSTREPSPRVREPRTAQAKAHLRTQTTTPPAPPPALICPSCDRPLKYVHSQIGGVNRAQTEQWDAYTCPSCGAFEYRQRTRRLRRVG